MSSWKASAQQLSEILQSRSRNESVILQLLDTLNTLVYPIENLRSEVPPNRTITIGNTYRYSDVGCGKPGTMLCGVQWWSIRWRVQSASGQVDI